MIDARVTTRSTLMATAAAGLLLSGAAHAQPMTGFYIGAGAGGNFMSDQSLSVSERVGAFHSSYHYPFYNSSYNRPVSSFGYHGRIPLDPGGAAVLSAGFGFGNGLRVEAEGDYRINSFSQVRGSEQKFGGMANVLYDLPVSWFGVTPYAGLGAGYMWVDRGQIYDRTASFAYQAILGGAVPVSQVPGLALTLEYRFLGLAGAEHSYTLPGYSFSGPYDTQTHDPSVGKRKFSDNFNHSVMVGVRYAFNAARAPVAGTDVPAPATAGSTRTYLVFFDWDRADLTDRARQIVAQAAAEATRTPVVRLEVSGHTDTTGTAQYNQRLSLRRAQAVAAELVSLGVPPAAITTQGLGFSRPLVATGPDVREPQNRRVEIVLR